jgi:hypothetical protein
LILVEIAPAIAPAVSVLEVYPPYSENTKSFKFVVEIPDTDGAAAMDVHVERELFGTFAFGSNGEPVFAPATANSSPDAIVGVPLRLIVITSVVMAVDAIPYHSVWVVSWRPLHAVKVALGDPCHDTKPSESLIEDTVIDDDER